MLGSNVKAKVEITAHGHLMAQLEHFSMIFEVQERDEYEQTYLHNTCTEENGKAS
jgi:hypothetical protein